MENQMQVFTSEQFGSVIVTPVGVKYITELVEKESLQ